MSGSMSTAYFSETNVSHSQCTFSFFRIVFSAVYVAAIWQNDFGVTMLYIIYLAYFSHFIKMSLPYRCAVNTTPQKMSDTAAQLESFMKEVSGNRKERKPVRTTVVEVRYQQANWNNKPVKLFVILTCRSNQNTIFFFFLWCFLFPH